MQDQNSITCNVKLNETAIMKKHVLNCFVQFVRVYMRKMSENFFWEKIFCNFKKSCQFSSNAKNSIHTNFVITIPPKWNGYPCYYKLPGELFILLCISQFQAFPPLGQIFKNCQILATLATFLTSQEAKHPWGP